MGEKITYQQCPSCGNSTIEFVLKTIDFTVSKAVFEIWHCNNCSLRFTQSVPSAIDIGAYYQSANYVSHTDTNKGLTNRLYHFIRQFTLKTKLKLVQQSTGLQTGALLDVGAGTGYFSRIMTTAGWQVTALEPDDTARKIALEKDGLILQDASNIYHLQSNQFDAITLWHVLEHVHDLQGYLDKFYNLLKPNGKLIIAVPNYTSADAEDYSESWAAYDVPRHLYHFSPQSIDSLAALKGFTVKAYKPMWFDSFYVSMLSEQYKNGKGNIVAAVFNGLLSNLKAIGNSKNCSSVIYILAKK
jgi:SAM-dependent methyltransferase